MALLSQCLYCDKMVSHSVSGDPLCEDHDGKKEAKEKERLRWGALSVEQKLDELKARLDDHLENPPWDMNTPIG